MITIEIGNVFALNNTQSKVAMGILRRMQGKKLKKLYPSFLKNFEKKLQLQLTDSFPVAHAITYPNGKAFVDVTFLRSKRPKWPSPKVSGSAYFLRRLQAKISELVKSGQIVTRNQSELIPYEQKIKERLKQDWREKVEIIKHSNNPEEVAEHLLLWQFIQPTEEILNIIYRCLSSEYEVVQNNAAYVLGNYLDKPGNWQLKRILGLLDSQFSAPINKGLYLLSRSLETEIPHEFKARIYQEAKRFIKNPQPNISEIAKMILEKRKEFND
jgi:hypothetical protein